MPAEPKISAALLDFARPLLELAPNDAKPEQWKPALNIAVAVWNAVVLETTQGKPTLTAEMRASATKHASNEEKQFMLAMLDVLEKRKRAEHPMDTRIIRKFEFVGEPDGGAVLRVECQAASHSPLPG
jgi:F0F1-type ATP synthase delta subunit